MSKKLIEQDTVA